MTGKQAGEFIWKMVYTAQVNQLYYEKLRKYTSVADLCLRLLILSLAIVGGICGLISQFDPNGQAFSVTSVSIGLIALAVGILIEVVPIRMLTQHVSELHGRWTAFRGESEKLLVVLDGEDGRAKIADDRTRQINHLQDEKTAIDKAEWPCLESLHRRCQRQINKRNYHVETGTFDEVMNHLDQTQAAGV